MEKAHEDFVVGQQSGAPVVAPAIGVGHRLIEYAMGLVESRWAGIVEIGQRAFLELFRGFGLTGWMLRRRRTIEGQAERG